MHEVGSMGLPKGSANPTTRWPRTKWGTNEEEAMNLGREVAGRGLPEGSPDPSEGSLSNPDLRWVARAFSGCRCLSRCWVKKGTPIQAKSVYKIEPRRLIYKWSERYCKFACLNNWKIVFCVGRPSIFVVSARQRSKPKSVHKIAKKTNQHLSKHRAKKLHENLTNKCT